VQPLPAGREHEDRALAVASGRALAASNPVTCAHGTAVVSPIAVRMRMRSLVTPIPARSGTQAHAAMAATSTAPGMSSSQRTGWPVPWMIRHTGKMPKNEMLRAERYGTAAGFQVAGEALDVGAAGAEQGQVAGLAPGGVLAQVQLAGLAGQAAVPGQEPG
jgi:hypothetical protein